MIDDSVSGSQSLWALGTTEAGGRLPAGGVPGNFGIAGEEQGPDPGGVVRPVPS